MILDTIDKEIFDLTNIADEELKSIFEDIDRVCLINSNRVLSAFIENKVSYSDFADINGYGNYDTGRDKLERIFSSVLGTEDALVRPQIMSGTNALYLAFTSLLKHGDTMISISGKPYDSLQEMVGIIGNSNQSLKALGINYEQIDLVNSEFDTKAIVERLSKGDVKLVEIQRLRTGVHLHGALGCTPGGEAGETPVELPAAARSLREGDRQRGGFPRQ